MKTPAEFTGTNVEAWVAGYHAGATASKTVDKVLAGADAEVSLEGVAIVLHRFVRDLGARMARQAIDDPKPFAVQDEVLGLLALFESIESAAMTALHAANERNLARTGELN